MLIIWTKQSHILCALFRQCMVDIYMGSQVLHKRMTDFAKRTIIAKDGSTEALRILQSRNEICW